MLSMHSFLGPLMAPLIKLLLLPRRLLIYAPAPVERAAIVAFNLAELVHAAFVYAVHVPGHVRVYGMLTLHDLDAWKQLTFAAESAWIAWTSDRILLDKTDAYDVCLDVSALMFPSAVASPSPAKPLARFVKHATLQPTNLSWSTRDLSLFLELAEQERRYQDLLESEGRPNFDAWCHAEHLPSSCSLHVSMATPWRYRQQDARMLIIGYLVVLVASIRFWLTEWWLIRSQLHVLVPVSLVMPLGVRGDGGLSTGIVDLSEDAVSADESRPCMSQRPCWTPATAAGESNDSMSGSNESVDPLIAANGLSQSGKSPRNSSSRRSAPSILSRRSSLHNDRSIIPAHPRYDPSDAPHLPLESMTGMYVFTLWSSYIRARHIQLSAFLEERISTLPNTNESSALLFPRTVRMTSGMFQRLGLDAGSSIDRAWIQSLLTPHSCSLQMSRWPWFW